MQSTEALEAIVEARGNLELAAEHRNTSAVSLVLALAQDPSIIDTLAAQLRILAMLHVFEMIEMSKTYFILSLDDLKPYEKSKTYLGLISSLSRMVENVPISDPAKTAESILKLLPPDVRQAVLDATKPETDTDPSELPST